MITELANDYSEYLKVDLTNELSPVMETIDDMLTRLEEFESLMDMVRTDASQCLQVFVPNIVSCKEDLRSLCDRIDGLESFVGRVKHDLDLVESQIEAAEATCESEGLFKNMLKPLFFKKADPVPKGPTSPPYEPPEIFNTSDYFLKDEERPNE